MFEIIGGAQLITEVEDVLLILLVLLFTHFIADFMFQTDEEAEGKSSDNGILFHHCLKYGLLLLVVMGPMYAFINAILHFATDFVTSRKAKEAFQQERIHDFFVIIGFDQFIHAAFLILTFNWIYAIPLV